MSDTPIFGRVEPGMVYTPRRACYAVICNADHGVAVVPGPGERFWLPGGGCETGESFEEALAREVREELGREIRLLRRIGQAVQYFHGADEKRHYKMTALFFVAEFVDGPTRPCEHDLIWLAPEQWDHEFFHECHAWAARQHRDSAPSE